MILHGSKNKKVFISLNVTKQRIFVMKKNLSVF